LFGEEESLNFVRGLSVKGDFLSDKKVDVIGAKGTLKISVVGPFRERTQVELSKSDCFFIGVKDVPLRLSGEIDGSAPVILGFGGKKIELDEGLIVAKRHLHVRWGELSKFGGVVSVTIDGERGGRLDKVAVRESNVDEAVLHLDTDEGNAFGGSIFVCQVENNNL
jgi:propanediol utilization protein